MNENFIVTIYVKAAQDWLRGFAPRLYGRMLTTMKRMAIVTQTMVKEYKLSGQVLKVRTGTLRRSINQKVYSDAKEIRAVVGTNVPYAGIHEYGGIVPAVSGKLMVFPASGVEQKFLTARGSLRKRYKTAKFRELSVFTMKHKQFTLPELSFLRSTLKEMSPLIEESIRRTTMDAIQG